MFSQLKFMFLQFKQNKSTAAVVNGLSSERQGGRKLQEKLRREEGSVGRRRDWLRGKSRGEGRPLLSEPSIHPSSEAPEQSVQHRLAHNPENSVCWQSALPAPVWCYYNSNPLVKTISARRLQHPYSFSSMNHLHCEPAVLTLFPAVVRREATGFIQIMSKSPCCTANPSNICLTIVVCTCHRFPDKKKTKIGLAWKAHCTFKCTFRVLKK